MAKETVLLAIDPYSSMAKKWFKELAFVQKLGGPKVKIQPTYVLGRDSLNWDANLSPVWLRNLKKSTFEKMSQLEQRKITAPPMILVNNKTSMKSDAEELCRYAKKSNSGLIVLHTHARKGMQRFLLGSFAETVMLVSQTPLLLFNPKGFTPKKVKRILVSIDLSKSSLAAFRQQIPLLKQLGAEVLLYNKMLDPIEPIVQSGVLMAGGGWVGLDKYRQDDKDTRERQLEELAKDLRRQGLKVAIFVDEAFGVVPERILKKSRDAGAQMIMLGTQTGALGAALFGSAARMVVRQAKLPVIVYPIR